MKSFRFGPIEANHYDDGQFSHYRLTLPVPSKIELQKPFKPENIMWVKNKLFFVFISTDWNEIQRQMAACQVVINDYKVCLYEQKKLNALDRLAELKN